MSEELELPQGATLNSDGSVNYDLAWPIDYVLSGPQRLTSVTVRRKRMSDNLAIKKLNDGADIAKMLTMLLCGLESKLVDQMDDVDVNAIGTIIESFTTPGRSTGSSAPA